MEGQGNKKGIVWAIVALALVVIVLVCLSALSGKSTLSKLYPKVATPKLVATAPQGKIVQGMPQDLIFVNDAVIEKSEAYISADPKGTTVSIYTLTYKTAATLKNLYLTYQEYAKAHGDAPMAGSLKPTTAAYSFRTTKSPNMIFNVTINDKGTSREVTIIINKQ